MSRRISELCYFGACPKCGQPACVRHIWKADVAVCHRCRLFFGEVGYNLLSCEARIWDTPAAMQAELGVMSWREYFALEAWQPEPEVADWEAFYDLVEDQLSRYECAKAIYDIGPPYMEDVIHHDRGCGSGGIGGDCPCWGDLDGTPKNP